MAEEAKRTKERGIILSLVNIKSGDTNPTLFFEKEKK